MVSSVAISLLLLLLFLASIFAELPLPTYAYLCSRRHISTLWHTSLTWIILQSLPVLPSSCKWFRFWAQLWSWGLEFFEKKRESAVETAAEKTQSRIRRNLLGGRRFRWFPIAPKSCHSETTCRVQSNIPEQISHPIRPLSTGGYLRPWYNWWS